MRFVVHLLDRPSAFAEIARVLVPGGRLVITTTDPAAVGSFWLARLFPSYASIERERFPSGEALRAELEHALFVGIRLEPFVVRRSFTRGEALAKLHGRAYSTFALLDEEEVAAGIARAERDLPETVEYELWLLHVLGVRPDLR